MEIGNVVGSVWATKKHEDMEGQKLLVVHVRETLLVAADTTGAGVGDLVLVCRGQAARYAAGKENIPVDAAIIGIIDSMEVQKAEENGGTIYGYQ